MAKSQSLWQVFEGAIVGIGGMVFLVVGFRDLYLANRSQIWPQTAGSIVSGQVHSGLLLKSPEIEYAKYPEGKTVNVSFDPKSADKAVLDPGFSADNIREIAWGVFALLTAFFVLRSEWHKFQAPEWEQEA